MGGDGYKGQKWRFFPLSFQKAFVDFVGLQNWMTFIGLETKKPIFFFFVLLRNLYSHLWGNLHTASSQYELLSLKLYATI